MTPAGGAVALAAVVTLHCPSPAAQPSIWDEARDPRARQAYEALLVAEAAVVEAAEADSGSALPRRFSQLAVRTLAPHLDGPDPRLTFVWAEVLSSLGEAWDREIIEALRPALAEIEDASLEGDGWYLLAVSAARLGDRELERSAYDQALELEWHPAPRANILYNRADAKLGLGLLRDALLDYRAAAALSPDPDTQALAYYGQGVTLERQGDLPSALRAMQMAVRLQPAFSIVSVLDRPSVFFVPKYDIHYYKALEAMARAEASGAIGDHRDDSGDPADERRSHLRDAANQWHLYLLAAARQRDRWVPNAQRHLEACERAIAVAAQPEATGRRRQR